MRIWSLHPQYLDAKGLVALWRETLLAKHVLENKTRGYKNHPQLTRFKKTKYPVDAINNYLSFILLEAQSRNYNFDASKIASSFKRSKLNVTKGQMNFEVQHLLKKLKTRDPQRFKELRSFQNFDPHPMFRIIEGEIESWEIL
ncbi:MAG: pyrimidine dimer DNA glycosylase/endonuclease V [Bacteroidota bacterium]